MAYSLEDRLWRHLHKILEFGSMSSLKTKAVAPMRTWETLTAPTYACMQTLAWLNMIHERGLLHMLGHLRA